MNERFLNAADQRTRRNIVKGAAILASAGLARAQIAQAGVCATARGCSCFLRGTNIQTADGERKIEDLARGELLPTMFGGVQAIKWIGRYPVRKSDPSKSWVRDALPIRIARSALAPNVPRTDLYVTAWHALFVDGMLVPAGCLINGTTIKLHEPRNCDELEYFHIKLESHDVIYAEGAPVETLLEVEESTVNFAEYFRRYGMPREVEGSCVPRLSYDGGRGVRSRIRLALRPWFDRHGQIDVIRDRLEERSILLSKQLEPSS